MHPETIFLGGGGKLDITQFVLDQEKHDGVKFVSLAPTVWKLLYKNLRFEKIVLDPNKPEPLAKQLT